MRVSRAPLRISLGGGGTDLPAYANRFQGFCVVGAITQYVRVVEHHSPSGEYILHYRDTERVKRAQDIQHPLFRACLADRPPVEIASFADLPGESGLGSSSAFAVAMSALRPGSTPVVAAMEAANVEQNMLAESVGKQDHYASAIGGVRGLRFINGQVHVDDKIHPDRLIHLRRSLAIYPSGQHRKAQSVLVSQSKSIDDGTALDAMHTIRSIGIHSYSAIVAMDAEWFGGLLHRHWEVKKSVSPLMSSPDIDLQYSAARNAGVRGGKLMGAGGGGYWLFSIADENRAALATAMTAFGSHELAWDFDDNGVTVREGL